MVAMTISQRRQRLARTASPTAASSGSGVFGLIEQSGQKAAR
jgi:hypothetical protein